MHIDIKFSRLQSRFCRNRLQPRAHVQRAAQRRGIDDVADDRLLLFCSLEVIAAYRLPDLFGYAVIVRIRSCGDDKEIRILQREPIPFFADSLCHDCIKLGCEHIGLAESEMKIRRLIIRARIVNAGVQQFAACLRRLQDIRIDIIDPRLKLRLRLHLGDHIDVQPDVVKLAEPIGIEKQFRTDRTAADDRQIDLPILFILSVQALIQRQIVKQILRQIPDSVDRDHMRPDLSDFRTHSVADILGFFLDAGRFVICAENK